MNEIKSFVIYREYFKLINTLKPKSKRDNFLGKLLDYYFKDIEPNFEVDSDEEAVWENIQKPIKKYKTKALNGLKGGRPKNENKTKNETEIKSKTETENKTYKESKNKIESITETETTSNDVYVYVNSKCNNLEVNKGVIGGEEETFRICKKVVGRLNELTNSNFKPNSRETMKLISGRLSEGYTEEDLIEVVEKMVVVWNSRKKGDKDMSIYLRPSTLFRPTNFENYLNMKVKKENVIVNDLIDTKGVFDD